MRLIVCKVLERRTEFVENSDVPFFLVHARLSLFVAIRICGAALWLDLGIGMDLFLIF